MATEGTAGRVVVIKFFAKYCEPCKRTLPAAQKLHEEYPQVVFIGVAEDEYQRDVDETVRAYGLTFPVIRDRGQALAGRFRVRQLPVSFVADSRGVVRWAGGASTTHAELEQAVVALLAR